MSKMTNDQLKQLQALPLNIKIRKTEQRIREWYEHWEGNVYVSFSGGKDSTVLLDIVRHLYPNVPAVFSDTGLEYPEIKEFVKTFPNVTIVRPKHSFKEILTKYGYPIISKEVANTVDNASRWIKENLTNNRGGVFDVTLTDIPYAEVNRKDNGLRNLDKSNADILTFDIKRFLEEVYRLTKGTIIIFCGNEQYSTIYSFFNEKSKQNFGTTRQIIWHKTNPSPMNGQHIYLSATENAVWFKKRGATFNAHCKHNVFDFPTGRSKIHPTEKNHELIKDLILDNSNEGDIIFDPCAGSLTHCLVAKENGRRYVGCELNREYFDKGIERLNK